MTKRFTKILGIAMTLAIVASLLVSSATLARDWGWEDVDIAVSEIDIDLSRGLYESSTVTAGGTVTVTAAAGARGLVPLVMVMAEAGYQVSGPVGLIVSAGEDVEDWDLGLFRAGADVQLTFTWEVQFEMPTAGTYTVSHIGAGTAEWWSFFGFRHGLTDKLDHLSVQLDCVAFAGLQVNVRLGHDTAIYTGDYVVSGIDVAGEYDGVQYRLLIPGGTTIMQTSGEILRKLAMLSVDPDTPSAVFWTPDINSRDISFSQPVTIYQAVGGKMYQDRYGNWVGDGWTEMMSFTEIVDGETQ